MSRGEMRARTDEALAQVLGNRLNPPDATARATLPVAADLAAVLAAEFGDDSELAGRVLVSAAGLIGGLVVSLQGRAGKTPGWSIPAAMVNVLAFAGEQLSREGPLAGDRT